MRSGRRVGEVVDRQVVPLQDLEHGLEVPLLTRVAGRDDGEQPVRQLETGLDHGSRLEWLERRTRVDEEFGVAEGAHDRPVGSDDHSHAVMQRFVEVVARRDGDRGERVVGEAGSGRAHGFGLCGTIFDEPGATISVRWLSTTS